MNCRLIGLCFAILLAMCKLSFCETYSKDEDVRLSIAENLHHIRHSQVKSDREFYDLPQWAGKEDFILTDHLPDGELERRISYKGITAKETSVGYNSSKYLSLWQVTDGMRFIQLIYSEGGGLIDCEYVRQKNLVRSFIHKFYTEVDAAKSRNFTSIYKSEERPSNNAGYDDDEEEQGVSPAWQSAAFNNVTYNRIDSHTDIPVELRQWLNYNDLKAKCFQRHRQMRKLMQGLNSKDEDKRKNATEHLERKKRGLSDWLMVPNTKWCGRGHLAGNYNQLGGASRADKCCRKHDHCKVNIAGMTTKWQLFNYFPYTISHCSCDTRFRTCLKMADSSDANMVGKLFFNIVQTKCFVLKTEKVCKKRSWWGKCEKKVLRKRAHLRNNRKF